MKINLMTHYAIRTIKTIAEDTNPIVTSNVIAEREGIPHGVLMKVLRRLRVYKIITSHQGRGEIAGGYSLRRPVSTITLLNILEIMEGPIELNTCSKRMRDPWPQHIELDLEYERITEIIKLEMSRYSIGELFDIKSTE